MALTSLSRAGALVTLFLCAQRPPPANVQSIWQALLIPPCGALLEHN